MKKWKRYRFQSKEEDYRPVLFNPSYPWWCSGYGNDFAIIIAFLPSDKDLHEYWPEAENIEFDKYDEIFFTGRFPKPEYYKDSQQIEQS